MLQRIDEKIEEIVDYIISKPADEITLDDYTILRDVQSQERAAADGKQRMEQLMALASTGFNAPR